MVYLPRLLLRTMSNPIIRRTLSSEGVVFSESGGVGFITLNNPKRLNAIDLDAVCKISTQLEQWQADVKAVVISGTGRAFCAGGDVVSITKDFPSTVCLGKQFFRSEYTLNYSISNYSIPYIAIMDGITMGGGVGLSVHGKYRIATEKTVLAMPETAIGLFPDVGSSYVLSRFPGAIGTLLALTGKRLNGQECHKLGIATHFMPSKDIPKLLEALSTCKIKFEKLDQELEKFARVEKPSLPTYSQEAECVDKIFCLPTIEDIYAALEKEGSGWALDTKATLNKMSPTALKITLKELQEAKNKDLKECLQMEYRLGTAALEKKISNDFYEGVRAMIVDKDKKPKWSPKSLEEVNDKEINSCFETIGQDELVL